VASGVVFEDSFEVSSGVASDVSLEATRPAVSGVSIEGARALLEDTTTSPDPAEDVSGVEPVLLLAE
jgi:hypothetical protein